MLVRNGDTPIPFWLLPIENMSIRNTWSCCKSPVLVPCVGRPFGRVGSAEAGKWDAVGRPAQVTAGWDVWLCRGQWRRPFYRSEGSASLVSVTSFAVFIGFQIFCALILLGWTNVRHLVRKMSCVLWRVIFGGLILNCCGCANRLVENENGTGTYS